MSKIGIGKGKRGEIIIGEVFQFNQDETSFVLPNIVLSDLKELKIFIQGLFKFLKENRTETSIPKVFLDAFKEEIDEHAANNDRDK